MDCRAEKLLEAEKGLTSRSDKVARRRQKLPWVRIDKEYRFDTDEGSASLADLFRGRSQLLIYHFMFGPDYKAGCPSCSAIADGFNGFVAHLANHDVMLWAISRAPLEKLQEYKRRMGWTFPWASSFGSDFNFDFDVSFTPEQQRAGIEYNYQREEPMPDIPSRSASDWASTAAGTTGTDLATYTRERPGMSAFALQNGVVHHTYSAYGRGLDIIWGAYQWFDAHRRDAMRQTTGGAAAASTSRLVRTPTLVATHRRVRCHRQQNSGEQSPRRLGFKACRRFASVEAAPVLDILGDDRYEIGDEPISIDNLRELPFCDQHHRRALGAFHCD